MKIIRSQAIQNYLNDHGIFPHHINLWGEEVYTIDRKFEQVMDSYFIKTVCIKNKL